MKYARRLSLLAAALVTLASALALQAAAGPPNHANRLEATFTETNVSVTNRGPDQGSNSDAADQAGMSRRYGGIHFEQRDSTLERLAGELLGSCGSGLCSTGKKANS